jgi:hypothetical protein
MKKGDKVMLSGEESRHGFCGRHVSVHWWVTTVEMDRAHRQACAPHNKHCAYTAMDQPSYGGGPDVYAWGEVIDDPKTEGAVRVRIEKIGEMAEKRYAMMEREDRNKVDPPDHPKVGDEVWARAEAFLALGQKGDAA